MNVLQQVGLTLQNLLAADDAERGRITLPLEHAAKVAVKRIPGRFVSSARRETGHLYSRSLWFGASRLKSAKHGWSNVLFFFRREANRIGAVLILGIVSELDYRLIGYELLMLSIRMSSTDKTKICDETHLVGMKYVIHRIPHTMSAG